MATQQIKDILDTPTQTVGALTPAEKARESVDRSGPAYYLSAEKKKYVRVPGGEGRTSLSGGHLHDTTKFVNDNTYSADSSRWDAKGNTLNTGQESMFANAPNEANINAGYMEGGSYLRLNSAGTFDGRDQLYTLLIENGGDVTENRRFDLWDTSGTFNNIFRARFDFQGEAPNGNFGPTSDQAVRAASIRKFPFVGPNGGRLLRVKIITNGASVTGGNDRQLRIYPGTGVYFHHAQIQRGSNTAIDAPPFVTNIGDGQTKQPGRADFSLPAYNNGTILITFTPQGFNFREQASFYSKTNPRILSGNFNDTALEFRGDGIRFRNRQGFQDLPFNFENYTTYKYGITFNRPDGVTRGHIKGPNGQDNVGQIAANPQGWEKNLQLGVDGKRGNVAVNSISVLSDTVTNAQLDTLTSI